VFVFAGYIAPVAAWCDFTDRWADILGDHPELRSTKFMKELVRRTPCDPRAVKLMSAITNDRRVGSIRWRLAYREYRAVVLNQLLGTKDNLYVFAWFAVLVGALATIRHIPGGTLDLFYDENIKQEKRVQRGYDRFHQFL
jgi:hypothetical protein